MTRNPLLYVLADGGRARLVKRAAEGRHYVTIEEIDHTDHLRALRRELRANPPVRVFSSHDPRRSSAGPEDLLTPAKEAFMGEVAGRASARAESDRLGGVVLVASPRLLATLRRRLGGGTRIAGTLGKNLTKVPDHELGDWLDQPFTAAHPALSRKACFCGLVRAAGIEPA